MALRWMFFEQYSHEPYVAVARFDLAPYPAINAWLERVRSQPRFAAMPRR